MSMQLKEFREISLVALSMRESKHQEAINLCERIEQLEWQAGDLRRELAHAKAESDHFKAACTDLLSRAYGMERREAAVTAKLRLAELDMDIFRQRIAALEAAEVEP